MYIHNLSQNGAFTFGVADVADGPRHREIWTSTIWCKCPESFSALATIAHTAFLSLFTVTDISSPALAHVVGKMFMGTGRRVAEAREVAAYNALRALGVIQA